MGNARFFSFFRHLTFVTLRKAIGRAFQRRLAGLSAEMAYNAMLALFPAIIAVLTATSMFETQIESTFADLAVQFEEILPEDVWSLIFEFVREIRLRQGSGWFSISFAAAIWVFSGALSAAMNALDQIHQVPAQLRRPFWKAKLISLVLTIGTIALLIVASFLVFIGDFIIRLAVAQNWGELLLTVWEILGVAITVSIVVAAGVSIYSTLQESPDQQRRLEKAKSIFQVVVVSIVLFVAVQYALGYIENQIARSQVNQTVELVLVSIWQLLSWPVALGIVATAFAFIYRFGASRWQKGTPLLPGAIVAAISWAGVSALFRLYVSNYGQYNRVYGAVGAVIVLMLWLYLSSLVMLLGDQLNATVGEAMQEKERQQLVETKKL